MKKMIVLAALALAPMATMAATTAVCTGTATGAAITATDTSFIKSTFTPTCSIDTKVSVDMDTTALWGGSISIKGKNYFAGSTNGGTISPTVCTGTNAACTDTDLASGVTKGSTMSAGT